MACKAPARVQALSESDGETLNLEGSAPPTQTRPAPKKRPAPMKRPAAKKRPATRRTDEAVESDTGLDGDAADGPEDHRSEECAEDEIVDNDVGDGNPPDTHPEKTTEGAVAPETRPMCKRPAAVTDLPVPGLENVPQDAYRLMPYKTHGTNGTMAIRRVKGKQLTEVNVPGASFEQNSKIAEAVLGELKKGSTENDALFLMNLMKASLLEQLKPK